MEITIIENKNEIYPINTSYNKSTLVTNGNTQTTTTNRKTTSHHSPSHSINAFKKVKNKKSQQLTNLKNGYINKINNKTSNQKKSLDKYNKILPQSNNKKNDPFKIIDKGNSKQKYRNYSIKKKHYSNNFNLSKISTRIYTERENTTQKERINRSNRKGRSVNQKMIKNNDKTKSCSNIKFAKGVSHDKKKAFAKTFISDKLGQKLNFEEKINNPPIKEENSRSSMINNFKTNVKPKKHINFIKIKNDYCSLKTSIILETENSELYNASPQKNSNIKNYFKTDVKLKNNIEEINLLHNNNLNSLLFLLKLYEHFLQTQFSVFINSYTLTHNSEQSLLNKDPLNSSISTREFLTEVESITKSIKDKINEFNSLITIHKDDTSQKDEHNAFITINEQSDKRKTVYNKYFDKCIENFNDIKELLKTILSQSKHHSIITLNKKRKLTSKQKINQLSKNLNINNKIDNQNDIEENTFLSNEIHAKVNLPKNLDFIVNKPKDKKMKYQLYKESSSFFINSDDDIKADSSGISKIVIGEIEPYKDIIDIDAVNNFKHQRSKSSFNLKNKLSKKKLVTKNMQILGEEEQISDLELKGDLSNSDDYDNDYDIDEYKANDKGGRGAGYLIPYHISKISFCKIFNERKRKSEITENYQDNVRPNIGDKEIKKQKSKIRKKKSSIKNFKLTKKKDLFGNKDLKIEKGEECLIF